MHLSFHMPARAWKRKDGYIIAWIWKKGKDFLWIYRKKSWILLLKG